MSQTLRDASDYLKLFLNTTERQAKLLLKSGTPAQVAALCEIAFNLLSVTVSQKVKKLINRCRKVFKKLGRKNLSTKIRIKLILSKFRLFITIILLVKPLLLQLISS